MITVPSSFEAFAGVAGLIAVLTIFYYALSRNMTYEVILKNRAKKDKEV